MTAQEFKKVREHLSLTQIQMAEMLGYDSYRMIYRKENGVTPVSKSDAIIIKMHLRETQTTSAIAAMTSAIASLEKKIQELEGK